MPTALSTDFRRYRHKVDGNLGALWRRPLAVRPPFVARDAAEIQSSDWWWMNGFAPRSFLDGQSRLMGISENNEGEWKFTVDQNPYNPEPYWVPSEGECGYKEAPNRAIHARRVLTASNSCRDVLEWHHSHVDHYAHEVEEVPPPPEDFTYKAWWDYVFDDASGPSHPLLSGSVGSIPYSPMPMSTDAFHFEYDKNNVDLYGPPGQQIYISRKKVYREPPKVSANMSWGSTETLQGKRIRIKCKCRRILFYPRCALSGNTIEFPDPYILREIDPADLATTQPYAENPFNDCRFWPFGITDAEKRFSVGGDADILSTKFNARTWQAVDQKKLPQFSGAHPERPDSLGLAIPYYPGAFKPANGFGIGDFTTIDLDQIDGELLVSGLKYAAEPWFRSYPVSNGYQFLPADARFDLLLDARFYRYWIYDWTGYDGTIPSEDYAAPVEETGFAGAYGDAYAII